MANMGGDALFEREPTCAVTRPSQEYVRLDGAPIALIEAEVNGDGTLNDTNAAVKFIHPGLLGEPRRATDSARNVVWARDIPAFGHIENLRDPDDLNDIGDARQTVGGVTTTLNLGLPGQYQEPEGVYYNWHRFYDPQVGRYWEADPLVGVGVESAPFAYVENRPTSASDPTGLLRDDGSDGQSPFSNWTRGLPPSPEDAILLAPAAALVAGLPVFALLPSAVAAAPPITLGVALRIAPLAPLIPRLGERGQNMCRALPAAVRTLDRFSRHLLDRLAERGIPRELVDQALQRGATYFDPLNKTIQYVLRNALGAGRDLVVGQNPVTGVITTAIGGSGAFNSRYIPIPPPGTW